jgi:SAM-dependent methyltransferase
MTDWFEDETFWEGFYDFLFPTKKFEAAKEEVDKLIQLVPFRGERVLDLACGPGRHSVAFAQKGYKVTGVDRSKYLLARAKNYAAESSTDVEWVREDMRDFVRPDAFHLCVSLFTSFGYFEKKDEDLLVLQNVFCSLKNDGFCIIDVVGKEGVARQYQPTIVHELPDGDFLIERPKIVDGWSRIDNHWIFVHKDTVRRFHFRHTIYSGQELRHLLHQAGFLDVKLYGDFDGNSYGPDSLRLVAVAQKMN